MVLVDVSRLEWTFFVRIIVVGRVTIKTTQIETSTMIKKSFLEFIVVHLEKSSMEKVYSIKQRKKSTYDLGKTRAIVAVSIDLGWEREVVLVRSVEYRIVDDLWSNEWRPETSKREREKNSPPFSLRDCRQMNQYFPVMISREYHLMNSFDKISALESNDE